MALPCVLHSSAIIDYSKQDCEELQVIEKGVYKKILSAQKYNLECILRGEIRSSMRETRIMKNKNKLRKVYEIKEECTTNSSLWIYARNEVWMPQEHREVKMENENLENLEKEGIG